MAKATAIFDGDDSRLSAAIDRIDKKLRDLQGRFAKVVSFATSVLAAPAAAAAGLALGVSKAFDVGGDLNDLSANTGIAIKDLMALQQEFKNAGKSADDVPGAIGKMQKALADGTANSTISKLGLNLTDLKKMTPVDQFHALGKAIDGMKNPTDRTAAAMALFGKSGASLLSMFASGGFGEAGDQVGSQADILQRDAALFDSVSDKLHLAGLKVQAFFVGVADKVAPVLNPLLDGFAKLDLAKYGQQVGEVIAFFIQAFADGALWDILVTSGQSSLMKVGNFFAGVIEAVAKGLWQYVAEGFKNGVAMLQVVTTADFWKGLFLSLQSAAAAFNALMLEGVAKILDQLAKVPGLGGIAGKGAALARSGAQAELAASGALAEQAGHAFTPAFETMAGRLDETFSNIGAAIIDGFKDGSSFFDVGAVEDRLAGQIEAVMSNVDKTTAAQLAANPVLTRGIGSELDRSASVAASGLTRIGGGSFGAAGGDPLLGENKRQTSLLDQIRLDSRRFHEQFENLMSRPAAAVFA